MIVRAVIDLMGGVVVRGLRGQRNHYQPIQSQLTPSTAPRDIARAIHEQTGIREFYLADLDAIQQGGPPDWDLASWFAKQGWDLWIDAGLRTWTDLECWRRELARPVLGTETFDRPDSRAHHASALGAVVSLDTSKGDLIGRGRDHFSDLGHAFREWHRAGCNQWILMDLARVGSMEGPTPWPEPIKDCLDELSGTNEFHAAGGVRHSEDLMALKASGFAGALVASLLHQGGWRGGPDLV